MIYLTEWLMPTYDWIQQKLRVLCHFNLFSEEHQSITSYGKKLNTKLDNCNMIWMSYFELKGELNNLIIDPIVKKTSSINVSAYNAHQVNKY